MNDADRKRRGGPVAYGIKAANTGEIVTVLYGSDVDQVGEYRADLVVPLYTTPQPAEPGLAKCAECGAEMIHVRPGKWQHPDCSQSPWTDEPVGYIMPSAIKQLKAGGNAIVGGVSQGGDVAVYLAPQPAEPVKVLSDADILDLWTDDPTHSRPVMGKNKVIAFARALLARYGNTQQEQP